MKQTFKHEANIKLSFRRYQWMLRWGRRCLEVKRLKCRLFKNISWGREELHLSVAQSELVLSESGICQIQIVSSSPRCD